MCYIVYPISCDFSVLALVACVQLPRRGNWQKALKEQHAKGKERKQAFKISIINKLLFVKIFLCDMLFVI